VESPATISTDDFERLAARLYTAVVSDALDAVGSKEHVLSPTIRPIQSSVKPLIGRAATARAEPVDEAPERPYEALMEAMGLLDRGEILIVAAGGGARSGIFGGLLATAARASGAVGCIVDGAIRDTSELTKLEFPTIATGVSYGRDEVVEYGRPVICGGVEIQPGQLIIADIDGVVAIPLDLEGDVIARALAKVDGEGNMRGDLAGGLPVAEAFAKYGIL
jgi:4-hydroxy-4-methyl-2-oxoglutarate aldolase